MAKLPHQGVVLLSALLIPLLAHQVVALHPILNLFEGGENEATFLVYFGSTETFTLNFVTNSNTSNLVTNDVDNVTVTINGGSAVSTVERVEADAPPGTTLASQAIDNVYEYRLLASGSNSITTEDYRNLLMTLRYISMLPNSSRVDPPRNITVVASGQGGDSNLQTALIMLVVSNEAPPVIDSRITVSVDENTANNVIFANLFATDPDGLDVTFSFQSASTVFAIASDGSLSVLDTNTLDYESPTQRRFELVVIATDTDPISPQSSQAELVINVNNINDNPPRFTSTSYTFNVNEEAASVEVGTIVVTDNDQEPITNTMGTVFFLLLDTRNEILQNFDLNRAEGLIRVRTVGLDFETTKIYIFQVQASDGIFNDTATVEVRVIDIPDNRPVITPAQKVILVNLDVGLREIFLTSGTGGLLRVDDSDSQFLQDGIASLTVSRGTTAEGFPNQYGACECTDAECLDVFQLCGGSNTFTLQRDFFTGASPASSAGPTIVAGPPFIVYSFHGRNGVTNNWLSINDSLKTTFLQTTNQFSLSFWLRLETTSGSSYIVAFELGSNRYFSVYDGSRARMILYYHRDVIPGVALDADDGYNSQVALSFYYNRTQLPLGLRDNQWHFLSLTIDFPSVSLLIDGVEYKPTRGNFRNEFQSTMNLNQVAGVNYSMPAPLLVKSATQIDDIVARIGGSIRTNNFGLFGEMRQLTLSSIIDNNIYACLASCNNIIGVDPRQSFPDFVTFYNPVTRTFDFTGPANAARYTMLLQSLVYFTNAFLLPQESGEGRVITLRINDERGLGSEAQINLIGRSNQDDPIIDANGDLVAGIDFLVTLREDVLDDQELDILSPRSFITDSDIDSQIVSVTVNLTNAQNGGLENIRLLDNPPSLVSVTRADGTPLVAGGSSKVVFITSVDPLITTANVFITTLLSLRYSNNAQEPSDVDRVIEFTVFDGLRTNNPRALTVIDVVITDDTPTVDLNGQASGTNNEVDYVESSPPTLLASMTLISDPDSRQLTQATARIDTIFDEGNETISFDSSSLGSGLSCIPSTCNGTSVTITGAQFQPTYQDVLRTLRYVNLKQLTDLPNLRDRRVFVTINDGANSSDPQVNILINFIPLNPRVIIELAAPLQNYSITFAEGTGTPIRCSSLVRVVDSSIDTLESIVVSIRDVGVIEDLESISLTTTENLNISIEINTALKRITFSQVANISQYLEAVRRIQYFNGELEPVLVNRFVDFLVIPGGGAPSDTAECNITILGVNDNAPVCLIVDPINISENSTGGLEIVGLAATDQDRGVDGDLNYRLSSGDSSLFEVTLDGLVLLSGDFPLDRETMPQHFFVVEVCDNGSPPLCCQFNITVLVTDSNDNPPEFNSSSYFLVIEENRVADFFPSVFGISDADQGLNSQLARVEIHSFSPLAGCVNQFSVRLESAGIILSVLSPGLDFEVASECIFQLVAYDAGIPSLSAQAMVNVSIIDQDDFPPEFSRDFYTFVVEEENAFPLEIGTVAATDRDSSVLTFSLSGAVDLFQVNGTSGIVSILFSSDRDIARLYTFTATVTDPPGRTDTVSITVNIIAINNDAPKLDLNVTDPDSEDALTPFTFIEEGAPVRILTNPLVTDPDDLVLTVTQISVEVVNSGNQNSEVLSVLEDPDTPPYTTITSTPGFLAIQPQNVTSSSDIHTLLQSIVYDNTEDELSACQNALFPCRFGLLSRQLIYFVNDGRFSSIFSSAFVVFELMNDPPLVDLDSMTPGQDFNTEFAEGSVGAAIANNQSYSISDEDSENLVSLICNLTNPLDSDEDSLIVTGPLPTGLSLLNRSLHVLEIVGDSSVSDFQTALGLVEYRSSSSNPDITNRLIEVYVTDDNMLRSNTAVTTVSFIPINDPPTLDLDSTTTPDVDITVEYTEDSPPVPLSRFPTVTDVDNSNIRRLTVTLNGGSGPQEVLSLNQSLLSTPLAFSYTYPRLLVTGTASLSTYETVIESIRYQNTDDEIANASARVAVFVITDGGGVESIPVSATINIGTIDDNPPTFVPINAYNFTVLENALTMSLVDTVTIVDLDLPPGRDIPTFTIEDASPLEGLSDFFILNNPTDPYQGQILVNGPIDYDMRARRYSLVIVAESSSRNASAIVLINVINLADIPPEFPESLCPPFFSTFENAALTPLTPQSCTAIDPDNLDDLRYEIEGNIFNGNPLITIDQVTGTLTVVDNVDRETIGVEFVVAITAIDSTQTTTRNITVIIQGLNEHNPEFNQPVYITNIEENAEPNGQAIQVLATDLDEVPDIEADPEFVTRITYSIESSAAPYFAINTTTGEITQLLVIDYEMFQEFRFRVFSSDNDASPTPRQALAQVIINVDNINDEPPQFVNLTERIVVSESIAVLEQFAAILAADQDINANLRFSILPPAPAQFLLTSVRGVLSATQPLDAEMAPREFEVTLQVEDIDTDPRYLNASAVTANTTIVIQDVNDEVPRFSSRQYSTSVIENSPAGSPVLNLSAVDNDYGLDPDGNSNGNNRLTYSFNGLNAPPANTFTIDRLTGIITTVQPLNREDAERYVFTVIVQDNPVSGLPQVDTATVTIDIRDINEFPPRADPDLYFSFISESLSVGEQIPTYAQATWNISLVPGMYLREVGESSLTGDGVQALLCQYLTIYENQTLSLSTVVYMGGDSCVNSPASVLLIEMTEATVTDVVATNITIPLTDDTRSDILGTFELDPTDDTFQRYLVLSTTFNQLQVTVLSRQIVFHSSTYVQALNGDILNGQLACYLANGQPVVVDTAYNVLTDFHNCSTVNGGFNVAALATTAGLSTLYFYFGTNGPCSVLYGPLSSPATQSTVLQGNSLSVGGAVYVRLGDPDCDITPGSDSACMVSPPFSNGVCDSRVGDDAEISLALLDFSITDPDGLANTMLTYSLSNDEFGHFGINGSSGRLSLITSIDSDVGPSTFTLGVLVVDGPGLFNTSLTVVVNILDENDNDPVPAMTTFSATISEALPINTFVLTPTFTDLDEGVNALLRYSIDPPSPNFTLLNSAIANITTSRVFDFEAGERFFSFVITAQDTSSSPRTGTANVEITISDANDNRPLLEVAFREGAEYIEDFEPVTPAMVVLMDEDSARYPLLYAAVTILNPFDGEVETLDLPQLPSGYKLLYSNFTLFIVGAGSPSSYASLLSNVTYQNLAVLFEMPLSRTISYAVCDSLRSDFALSMLTADTQRAISATTATSPALPTEDAQILFGACLNLVGDELELPLIETNDRPEVLGPVQFLPIAEDIAEEENRGLFVVDLFGDVIIDTDRDSVVGIAVVAHDGPASLQTAQVSSNEECLALYVTIANMGPTGCRGQQLDSPDFCGCPIPGSILSCLTSPSEVIFACVGGTSATFCSCDLPASPSNIQPSLPEFSDIESLQLNKIEIVVIDLSHLLIPGNRTVYTIETTQRICLIFPLSIVHVVLGGGGTVNASSFPFSITNYEDVGDVTETSSHVLGPLSLIRWVPRDNLNGIAFLTFKGWDTTSGETFGRSTIDTTNSTAFSLGVENANVTIVPENDPPEIRLGGDNQVNYSTSYIEGGPSVLVSDRNAAVLDFDVNDLFLFNLTVSISTVGGGCALPDFPGVSQDRLTYLNTTIVPLEEVVTDRTGQACVTYSFIGDLSVDQWRGFITMMRFSVDDGEPSEHTRELTFAINDRSSTSELAYTTINVTLVSDICPTISLATGPTNYTEHGPPVELDGSLVVADEDRNPEIGSASVQIMATTNDPCSTCELNISLSSLPNGVMATVGPGTTLTITGAATPEEYQTLLRTVYFQDTGDEPSFNLVMIRFTLRDPSLVTCPGAMADIGVMIEHINDNSPLIYLNYPTSQDFSTTFTEGTGSTVRVTGSVRIIDNDVLNSDQYRVQIFIASGCVPSEDRLEIPSPMESTLVSEYNQTTCSLTIEASATALERDISQLLYSNLDIENPDSTNRSITFSIVDGLLPPTSAQTLLLIRPVNDRPLIDLDVTNLVSSDAMVVIMESQSGRITPGAAVIDSDDVLLVSMTLVLTEIDVLGAVVSPRSDEAFEVLELYTSVTFEEFGFSGTFVPETGQFLITGQGSPENYTTILNNVVYTNRRVPPSDANRRRVAVVVSDGDLVSLEVSSFIMLDIALNPPLLDLNGEEAGTDVEAVYTITNSPLPLFPTAFLADIDGDHICTINITMTGPDSTCLPNSIDFANAYSAISVDAAIVSDGVNYLVSTTFPECLPAIVFEDVLRGVRFSIPGAAISGMCTLLVTATEIRGLDSNTAMATVEVRAFNAAPFIDLDLGLTGRDFSTIYFQGGRTQHIVSIFDAARARNITDMTVVGEAMDVAAEAPTVVLSSDADFPSFDDGTQFHGVVILEESYAGYVLRDVDSPTLSYLQVEFFAGANLEHDVISFPCEAAVPIPAYGCRSSNSAPLVSLTPQCNNSVFDACTSNNPDLCSDLQVTIFCSTVGRKAYRFEYLSNGLTSRYETLLGLLGYDFLPDSGGPISQMRLLNISVFDPLSEMVNSLAITRVRIQNQDVLVIDLDPPSFIVYEDERPLRTCTLYTVRVRRLDGTVPASSELILTIAEGNIGNVFGINEDGVIFLNGAVDREVLATLR